MNKPKFGEVIVAIPGKPEKHIQRPPAGWEVVGEVTDHFGGGALIKATDIGIYAQANTNSITSLPQAAVRDALAAQAAPNSEQE